MALINLFSRRHASDFNGSPISGALGLVFFKFPAILVGMAELVAMLALAPVVRLG